MYIFHSHRFLDSDAKVTIVGLQKGDDFVIAAARCSDQDNFCKKTGVNLAKERIDKGEYLITIHNRPINVKRFNEFALSLSMPILSDARVISESQEQAEMVV